MRRPEIAAGAVAPGPRLPSVPAWVRLVHPAPAAAVVALSAALAVILAQQAGDTDAGRVILTVLAVAGSQVATGAVNDWADRGVDAAAGRDKPIPSAEISPRAALLLAAAGIALQLGASLPLGWLTLLLGLAALVSAQAYNLVLSRTALSPLPYLISFGVLPLWIAAGVGVPLARVAPAALLVAPFAVAAHLANALRDFDVDARLGSGNLAQRLGRRSARWLAGGLALGVGLGVGIAFAVGGHAKAVSLALGAMGLVAIALGIGRERRLWYAILVAALAWTAAWAIGTG